YKAELSKTTGNGSGFSFRNITDYARNNSPLNTVNGIYKRRFEVEWRQPLLQGAGTEFKAIAGPNARPGQYNGVLLARINGDISLTEFESGIRDMVRNIEIAYWDLYYAYQNLEARKVAHSTALETWRTVNRRLAEGDASPGDEIRARAEYYFFENQVIDGL